MTMDERKYRILQAIIDDYILTAMPVGSRTISRKYDMGLSSATIRNEMSDLEELGYLDQPHTSAGRIPSYRAYRLYVEKFIRIASLPQEENERIQSIFSSRMGEIENTMQRVAEAISSMTDYAAVVTTPQVKTTRIHRVQLVPVDLHTALMVVVTSAGIHKDSMIHVPESLTPDQLNALSNFLSDHLYDVPLNQIGEKFREINNEFSQQHSLFKQMLDAFLEQAEKDTPQVILGGTSKLLTHPEYSDIGRARALLSTLETKDQLASLMRARSGLEFSVSIGPEIRADGMRDCSLVTVGYHLGNEQSGTLGVIGPIRMQYGRVLSVLNSVRKMIDDAYHDTR